MTRIAVLGASGSVGSVIVRELLEASTAQIIAVDLAPPVLDLPADMARRLIPVGLDIGDPAALAKVLRGSDIVVNAAAMRFAMPVTRAAIAARADLVDLGTFVDTNAQLALSDEAAAAGVRVVIGAGVAPGLTNVLARYGADQFDQVDRICIYSFLVNAMFESPANILDRFAAARLPGLVHRGGTLVQTEPLAEVETIEFALPEGRQLVHLMPHPETLTLPTSLGVPNVEFKTGYPPQEDAILDAFRLAGLDSVEPFDLGGNPVIPREVVAAIAGTTRRGSLATTNAKRVTIDGSKDGRPLRLLYEMAVRVDGGSATSRITGAMAAIATLEVRERGIRGVLPPERGLDPGRVLQALGARGFRITETQSLAPTTVAGPSAGQ